MPKPVSSIDHLNRIGVVFEKKLEISNKEQIQKFDTFEGN